MPISPNFIERLFISTLNQGPGPMLDIWSGVAFHVILAAIRLGVFEALDNGSLSLEELIQKTKIDPRGAAILLEALEALGYVEKQNDRYANASMTTKWLVSNSAANFAPYFRFWGKVLPVLWHNLEDSLRSGEPPVHLYEWIEDQPETSQDFQQAMIALAHLVADEIVRKLKVPPTIRRVLDVGGGHAAYSIALCRRHPALMATVFDSPEALVTGRENVAWANLEARITVQEGDFLVDELGSGYDMVLIFNIIHGFTPTQNIILFRKAAQALNPGGLVVVAEQLAGSVPGQATKAISRLLGVSYFHMLGGQIYAYDEVTVWLKDAGFNDIRRINLLKAPGNSLVLGQRLSRGLHD